MKKVFLFLFVVVGYSALVMLSKVPDPSKPGDDIFGITIVSDELLELKREGQARGEIEAGSKIDYRKAVLVKGSVIKFNIDCEQELTNIKITLTERNTGHFLEDKVIGKGELSFEIESDGEYVITIENCSDKGTHFTIEYCINSWTNAI